MSLLDHRLEEHPAASRWLRSLTALSVALGVALMVAVLVINGVVTKMFSQSGAWLSPDRRPAGERRSDLVLSTVYRTQLPSNNLPWRFYKPNSSRATQRSRPRSR